MRENHLPYKKKYKKKYSKDKRIRKPGGISIEQRTAEINNKQKIGHWEMDTVVGKKASKGCLLVLTERFSRKEIIIKLEKNDKVYSRSSENTTKKIPKNIQQ